MMSREPKYSCFMAVRVSSIGGGGGGGGGGVGTPKVTFCNEGVHVHPLSNE